MNEQERGSLVDKNEAAGPGGPAAHRVRAEGRGPVAIGIVTVSDSRTPETDDNGRWLKAAIETSGHSVAAYLLVRDEPAEVIEAFEKVAGSGAQIVIFNGGTGVARRDTTVDAIAKRFERELPGFGELFRMLSWREIGSAAMLSRATAGIWRDCVVFCLPGSAKAVELAWSALIEPEVEHLAWELVR